MENLKYLFDITKLPTKFFFLFTIISGILLFTNNSILQKIHLEKINDSYGWIIGLVFIFSLGLVVINFFIWVLKFLLDKINFIKIKKDYKKSLKHLDFHEKSVLREFVLNDQTSIEMPIDNPIVSGLLKKRILTINKQFGNSFIIKGFKATVSLSYYAEKFISLADVDLSENPDEKTIQFAKENRPEWIKNSWHI